jgi:hypothetical protein
MNQSFDFDSAMTLGEAMQKMQALQPEDFTDQVSLNTIQALEQHDAVHILFGLDTSIQDEIAAHVWMIFATTANIGEMHNAVATQEHRRVLSKVGHFKLMSIWLFNLPRIINILFKSLRMKQKIVVEELSQLKTQTVLEIRRAHGIDV